MSLRYILLKLKDNVDFHITILDEKSKKNEKKTHRFNVVYHIAYVHGNKEKRLSLYLKLGLHKRVFMLTLR